MLNINDQEGKLLIPAFLVFWSDLAWESYTGLLTICYEVNALITEPRASHTYEVYDNDVDTRPHAN